MTWPTVTLNDLQSEEPRAITDGPFGSNLASRHYTEAGPRVVRLQNIGDGQFLDEKAHISEEHFESLRVHEVQAGDLLVASLGEVLPRACLAPVSLGPAIVKADCIRVRLRQDVDPRWVLYALQRPEVRRWADEHRHGVGRPRLGLKVIRQIPVPLPSLDEQRRIVDLLEDHLSRLDAAAGHLDAARRRAELLLDSARESIWDNTDERTTIAEFGEVITGKTPPTRDPANAGDDVPFVTPGDLAFGNVVHAVQRSISERGVASSRTVAEGSVLVVCIGATLGKVGYTERRVAFNQQINAVALPSTEEARLLAAAMAAPSFQRVLRAASSATTMPILNKSNFARLHVPRLSSSDRGSLLERISEASDAVENLRCELEAAVMRSSALRRSLLAAVFSGRLTGAASEPSQAEEVIKA
jgi:type I restriction enzyme, S subunit